MSIVPPQKLFAASVLGIASTIGASLPVCFIHLCFALIQHKGPQAFSLNQDGLHRTLTNHQHSGRIYVLVFSVPYPVHSIGMLDNIGFLIGVRFR